jgi:hypothetical protein
LRQAVESSLKLDDHGAIPAKIRLPLRAEANDGCSFFRTQTHVYTLLGRQLGVQVRADDIQHAKEPTEL